MLLLSACSDNPAGVSQDDLTFDVENNGLSVFNNSELSIFYFTVERGVAAQIFWLPVSSTENEITSNNKKFIPFSEIFGFDMSEEILFFFWNTDEPESSEIRNRIVSTGE